MGSGLRISLLSVILKIITKEQAHSPWQNKDLAGELFISQAEISGSLDRSSFAGLLTPDKKRVHKQTFLEFIEYGLRVVFPAMPGGMTTGLYTSHAHHYMQKCFSSNEKYVWPALNSDGRGQSILPLYKQAVKAALLDDTLYKMLALIDVVRVGKVRELKLALKELKNIIKRPVD